MQSGCGSLPDTMKQKNVTQPAWNLFCKGDLAGAEQAAATAIRKLNSMAVHPVPDIMIIKAFYSCRLGHFQEARSLFGRVLEACPDDVYAQQGYLLALQDELALKAPKKGVTETGTLLLGLGTGRSGSTTLAKLWREQQGCYCSHEHPPRLPWKGSSSRLEFHQRRFDILRSGFKYVGDVSHWWLPYVDTLMDDYKDVRVVVLKRDRKATVDSFLKIKGGPGKGAINHWINHDGRFWARNIWDECYPSYEASNMKEAIERYWQDYYATVDSLIQRFPSSIRVFPTEQLSDPNTQVELLSFCGFMNPRLKADLYLNKGDAVDGLHMY